MATSTAVESADRILEITRVFDAPRALVFKAWTQPDHLARWWGPRGYGMPSCQLDLRQGGAYRFQMKSPTGRLVWWHGVVREVVEPERLVLTCAINNTDGTPIGGETILTVTLQDLAGKTRLTLRQAVFETSAIRDDHSNGWHSSFDRLAELLAAV